MYKMLSNNTSNVKSSASGTAVPVMPISNVQTMPTPQPAYYEPIIVRSGYSINIDELREMNKDGCPQSPDFTKFNRRIVTPPKIEKKY